MDWAPGPACANPGSAHWEPRRTKLKQAGCSAQGLRKAPACRGHQPCLAYCLQRAGAVTAPEVSCSFTPSEPGGRNLIEGVWVHLSLERFLGGPIEPQVGWWYPGWAVPGRVPSQPPSALALSSQQPHLCPLCVGSKACPGCWVSWLHLAEQPEGLWDVPQAADMLGGSQACGTAAGLRVLGECLELAGSRPPLPQMVGVALCALGPPQCQEALSPASA